MAINLAVSGVVVTATPGTEGATSGCNGGLSLSCVGLNSGDFNPKVSDWSREKRLLQGAQPIGWGGDSVVTGQLTADIPPLKVVDYGTPDFNDNISFTVAVGAVAPDAVIADGAVNRTGKTMASGDWAWGTVPVA